MATKTAEVHERPAVEPGSNPGPLVKEFEGLVRRPTRRSGGDGPLAVRLQADVAVRLKPDAYRRCQRRRREGCPDALDSIGILILGRGRAVSAALSEWQVAPIFASDHHSPATATHPQTRP